MITHYIILSSSYSRGKRIALHYPFAGIIDDDQMQSVRERIKSAFTGTPPLFAVHVKQTDSESWDSVTELDSYFKGVEVIGTVDEFVDLISKDRTFEGVDVARYILSITRCTHTRLEKLTYLCYADYLCKTGKRLFEDKIYAFQYGPVVYSVYSRFRDYSKEHASEYIPFEEIECERQIEDRFKTNPVRSRLLFADDGIKKVYSINETLEKDRDYDGVDLVKLTHGSKTPWSEVKRTGRFDPIEDDLIIKYHANEEPVPDSLTSCTN